MLAKSEIDNWLNGFKKGLQLKVRVTQLNEMKQSRFHGSSSASGAIYLNQGDVWPEVFFPFPIARSVQRVSLDFITVKVLPSVRGRMFAGSYSIVVQEEEYSIIRCLPVRKD